MRGWMCVEYTLLHICLCFHCILCYCSVLITYMCLNFKTKERHHATYNY